jgi:4-hydroxybenzoate polyprenyltransferase
MTATPETMPAPLRRLRGVAAVAHPFPAAMNGAAAAAFYAIAAWPPDGAGLAAITLSALLVHAAIGSLNDWHDLDLDRATRPEKPVVRGDISRDGALAVASIAAALGLALSASFNLATLGIAVLVLAAGIAYDLALKGTVVSFVPYGVAIPALPVWSFVAAGHFAPALLLAFPFGALIALALNLANTIPDLAGDTAHGLRGLAHRLGLRRSLAATWGAFAASLAALALTPVLVGNDGAVLLPGLGLALVLLAATVVDVTVNRTAASLKRGWYVSAVIAALIGLAFVASLPAAEGG